MLSLEGYEQRTIEEKCAGHGADRTGLVVVICEPWLS